MRIHRTFSFDTALLAGSPRPTQTAPSPLESKPAESKPTRFIRVLLAIAVLVAATHVPDSAVAASRGKVLVILSSADIVDLREGKTYHAGYYLDELEVPLRKMVDAGYEPVIANPNGNAVTYDPASANKMYYGNDEAKLSAAIKYMDRVDGVHHPKTLSQVLREGTSSYVGIFIPGGYAPMQDLISNKTLGDILLTFHANGRPTGLICHGPATLVSTVSDPVAFRDALAAGDWQKARTLAANWPYAGYRMTVITISEEHVVEGMQLGGKVLIYPGDALAQAGAHVDSVAIFASSVVEDREVVSGQQPFSAEALGDAFVAKLNAATHPN